MSAEQWDYPSPHVCAITVSPGDMDSLEHTNNGVYVNWCEHTAWSHSRSLGLGEAEYQSLDRAMALRRAEYDYLQATRAGDELLVATWITRWDRRLTMERRFQILHAATGSTVLRARLDFVCIEISSGKPRKPPRIFIDAYGPVVLDIS